MRLTPMRSTAMVNIMSTPLFNDLPAPLKSVQTQPLFVMRLDVKPIVIVGETPGPFRRIGIVPSGTFAGERLSGKVLDGGSDWQTVRSDASTTLDVRLILQPSDGVHITIAYRGGSAGHARLTLCLRSDAAAGPCGGAFFLWDLLAWCRMLRLFWLDRRQRALHGALARDPWRPTHRGRKALGSRASPPRPPPPGC